MVSLATILRMHTHTHTLTGCHSLGRAEDRNGHPAYSQIDMQPQTAPDGSVTFIGALTDTSNIKKLERLHVQEVEQRANDAVKMKQIAELNVDLASHEIR